MPHGVSRGALELTWTSGYPKSKLDGDLRHRFSVYSISYFLTFIDVVYIDIHCNYSRNRFNGFSKRFKDIEFASFFLGLVHRFQKALV